jgi:dCTP diphosphatase
MDRLEAIIKDLQKFVAEREWKQFHDPKNLAMAVASEAGRSVADPT